MTLNGGRPRKTYVAEFGSALTDGREVSEYMLRVMCTRCSPPYRGAILRLSAEASLSPGEDPMHARRRMIKSASAEALRHAETFHGS